MRHGDGCGGGGLLRVFLGGIEGAAAALGAQQWALDIADIVSVSSTLGTGSVNGTRLMGKGAEAIGRLG